MADANSTPVAEVQIPAYAKLGAAMEILERAVCIAGLLESRATSTLEETGGDGDIDAFTVEHVIQEITVKIGNAQNLLSEVSAGLMPATA